MNKKIILVISITLFLVLVITTVDKGNEPENHNNTTIRTGLYFGECLGYCEQEIIITSKKIIILEIGEGIHNSKYPTLVKEMQISEEVWTGLIAAIDLEKIDTLPKVIGCPDCGDWGGEWIQVNQGNYTKRIDFDYDQENQIPEINNLIQKLRIIRNQVNN